MKKIPKVNYLKVFILFLITVAIVFLLVNIYNEKNKYNRASDEVMNFLATVKYEELNEYLTENPDGFIYVSSSLDVSLDSFEEELKKMILDNDLAKYFVYLDSSQFNNNIYSDLKKNYLISSLKNIDFEASNLFFTKDGKIEAVLGINTNNITEVKYFIDNHEVVE